MFAAVEEIKRKMQRSGKRR